MVSQGQIAALRALVERLDLRPGPGGSRITPLGEVEAACREILQDTRPWSRSFVVALEPSQQLVGHTDPPIRGQRWHLPLVVNDGCWVFHDGVWKQLAVGEWCEMDPTRVHGAVNWGLVRRLHLVADVEGEGGEVSRDA